MNELCKQHPHRIFDCHRLQQKCDTIEPQSMPRRLLSQISSKFGRSSLDGRPPAPGSAAPDSSQPSGSGYNRSGTVWTVCFHLFRETRHVQAHSSRPIASNLVKAVPNRSAAARAGVPMPPVGQQPDVDAKIAEAESMLVEAERRCALPHLADHLHRCNTPTWSCMLLPHAW